MSIVVEIAENTASDKTSVAGYLAADKERVSHLLHMCWNQLWLPFLGARVQESAALKRVSVVAAIVPVADEGWQPLRSVSAEMIGLFSDFHAKTPFKYVIYRNHCHGTC